jgi:hypothetical protein
MKNIQQLMQEIIRLTSEIETKYPEVYKYLEETPLLLWDAKEKNISTSDLESYLNTLKELLEDYLKTHQKSFANDRLQVD